MDYETRCMREWKRKLIREALSDYHDALYDYPREVVDAAWSKVKTRFAERHAHVANAPGSYASLMQRDRARWAYKQEADVRRAKAVAK